MNRALIARNLLILQQLHETALRFAQERIPAMVLKGAALLSLKETCIAERPMEDIDLMVRPDDISRSRSLLVTMGYAAAPEDPNAFNRAGCVPIDLIDRLWYLDKTQNRELWNEGRPQQLPGMPAGIFHLPFDEFYVHVLAHAAIHHARKERIWLRDLEIIRELGGNALSEEQLNDKLSSYGFKSAVDVFLHGKGNLRPSSFIYRWLLRRRHPESGHIARFLFLPLGRKFAYVAGCLFPPKEFVRTRYSLTSPAQVRRYRILRPFFLFKKLCMLALR